MGAAMPILSKPGSKPIRNVENPITEIVKRKVHLRPTLSPIRPNTIEPSGRTAKPAAKLRSVKTKAAPGLTPEKNCLLMMTASEPAR
jgi:hypothetical protein